MLKNLDNDKAIEKLQSLVKSVKICMFATMDEASELFSRPMATVKVDDDGGLWFYSNEFSEKVQDIAKEHLVYLFYSHPGQNSYLHVKGMCRIVNDINKIKELWTSDLKAWFPEGADDPKICLLKVSPLEASYWDSPSSKLVVFYKMVKAVISGEKANVGNMGSLNI